MSELKRVEVALQRDLSAPSKGRAAVRSLLDAHVERSFVSDALLATSELVTNALLHAHGALDISAGFDRERRLLRVEVSDSSSDVPRPVDPVPNQPGGRGLGVVADVSSAWGCTLNEHGKTMWFELC